MKIENKNKSSLQGYSYGLSTPLACFMMFFEISLFLLDLSSSQQEYIKWKFLSCIAFDEISSQLEVADSVASLRILHWLSLYNLHLFIMRLILLPQIVSNSIKTMYYISSDQI